MKMGLKILNLILVFSVACSTSAKSPAVTDASLVSALTQLKADLDKVKDDVISDPDQGAPYILRANDLLNKASESKTTASASRAKLVLQIMARLYKEDEGLFESALDEYLRNRLLYEAQMRTVLKADEQKTFRKLFADYQAGRDKDGAADKD